MDGGLFSEPFRGFFRGLPILHDAVSINRFWRVVGPERRAA